MLSDAPITELTKIDIKILKALFNDARTSFSDIARDCNVSTPLIHLRFNKLKQSGIITGTTLFIDEENEPSLILGLELNVKQEKEESIIRTLKEIPNFRNVQKVIGKFDIHAVYYVKTIDEISKIRNILANEPGIKSIKYIASKQIFGIHPENLQLQQNVDE